MNQSQAFKALLFDADGTLYNSPPLHFRVYRQTCRQLYDFDFTLKLFKEECIGKYKKPSQVLREHGVPCVDADFRAVKGPLYAALATEELRTTEGLTSLLETASTNGIPCAVVTGASRHSVDFSLDLLDLRKYFSVIVLQEDTDHQKPHPHPYLLAAERLGLQPSECCAFEDTALGIASAKAAGMFCIAIRHEENTPEELATADHIVPNFRMLQTECTGAKMTIVVAPTTSPRDPAQG